MTKNITKKSNERYRVQNHKTSQTKSQYTKCLQCVCTPE